MNEPVTVGETAGSLGRCVRSSEDGGVRRGCEKRQRTARTPKPGGVSGVADNAIASWSARSPLPLLCQTAAELEGWSRSGGTQPRSDGAGHPR
jgi:hypothetical protein